MLEITSPAQEAALGVNFTDIYMNSELYRYNLIMFFLIIDQNFTPPVQKGKKQDFFVSSLSYAVYIWCQMEKMALNRFRLVYNI